MKRKKTIIGILCLGICTLLLLSCNTVPKSKLVKHLEAIIYNDAFVSIPSEEFNVADYGAINDGKTLTTKAIQNTIDAASEAGGGRVVFPKGIYLSGALFIKSNVDFHLDEGVIIRAIQDDSQYPESWTRIAGFEMEWPAGLINIYDQHNVRISGKGTIDGNGKYWWDKFWGDPAMSGGMWVDYKKRDIRWAVDYDCKRVRGVVVYKSNNVQLKDFQIQRSGFWTVSLTYSERVHVDGVIVRNNINGFGPSSDGIDTDSSKDVLVENCDVDCNDDNFCIKSGRDADGLRVNRPAENIVYRNCISRSGHGLIVLGSETSGGMKNIEIYGLSAKGTNTGIRFKSAKVRGGVMSNIIFHDITMEDVDFPFHFELNWYPEYSYPVIPDEIPESEWPDHWKVITKKVLPVEKGIPEFFDISFKNISITGAKQALFVNAFPEKPMRNILFDNVSIQSEKAGFINYGKDWQSNDFTISTQDGSFIELLGCENIDLPQTVIKKDELVDENILEKQLQALMQEGQSIVVVNEDSKKIVLDRDTITQADRLSVYVKAKDDSQLTFYEPLGDGFYISPVTIQVSANGTQVEVKGQKVHNYQLVFVKETEGIKVEGADAFYYDKENNFLLVNKKERDFIIVLKK